MVPPIDTRYLYLASDPLGIRRVTYDLSSQTLVPGSLETVAADIVGLGIAFDGDTLYASAKYVSDNDRTVELSRLWRIEDRGFGTRTEIVQGIPRQDHGVNNIQIVDHTLYVGIGVRTRNGAFETWSGDAYGESAYGGSIGIIDDLRQVGVATNAAGFFPGHPTAVEYEKLINGQDPIAASPYTTTEPGKLRVHSSGTRNPFGTALDGEGQLWFTTNFQRVENDVYDRDNLANAEGDAFGGDGFQDDVYDQLFRAAPKADYGYRNGNWQNGNAAGNTSAVDAGFFARENRTPSFTFDNYVDPVANGENDDQNPAYNHDYQIDSPVGLGPSSSANGLAFYQANAFPLPFHQNAFIARWNGTISDGDDSLTYRDVVSVNKDTGEVRRIAAGFRNPLDVIEDGLGNLIVADHGGSVYLISAAQPQLDAYAFSWDSDQSGTWSDRLQWNAASLAESDRKVPHAWGTARYAVTVDRPNADVTVALDRDVHVESVQLGERLELTDESMLTVDDALDIRTTGQLVGGGSIEGRLINHGQVQPGSAARSLEVTDFQQAEDGRLAIELPSDSPLRVDAQQSAELGGELSVQIDLSNRVRGELLEADVVRAPSVTGEFRQILVNDRSPDSNGHISDGHFFNVQITATAAHVRLYSAFAGDANGDGLFDSSDLIRVFAFGEYEDGVAANSDWTEGDWDQNLDFDSGDIILAFQRGGYVSEARSVPEPAGIVYGLIGSIALLCCRNPDRRSAP